MKRSWLHRTLRLIGWLGLELLVLAGAAGISVWADTSSRVQQPNPAGCYCGCAQSKTSAGCGKMCELPKYSSRWWATSCAKPRVKPPTEQPGAGPRLPHPPRAERASN